MQTINAQREFPLSPEETEERKHEAVELLRCAADSGRDVGYVAFETDASLYTYSLATLWLEHVLGMWSIDEVDQRVKLEAALILEGTHGTETHAVRGVRRRTHPRRRNAAAAQRRV